MQLFCSLVEIVKSKNKTSLYAQCVRAFNSIVGVKIKRCTIKALHDRKVDKKVNVVKQRTPTATSHGNGWD
jgi:hypothetical protein